MRKYSYNKEELNYIFSLIKKDTYTDICSHDEYLPDGRLITPMLHAQHLEKGRQKMMMLKMNQETSTKTKVHIG